MGARWSEAPRLAEWHGSRGLAYCCREGGRRCERVDGGALGVQHVSALADLLDVVGGTALHETDCRRSRQRVGTARPRASRSQGRVLPPLEPHADIGGKLVRQTIEYGSTHLGVAGPHSSNQQARIRAGGQVCVRGDAIQDARGKSAAEAIRAINEAKSATSGRWPQSEGGRTEQVERVVRELGIGRRPRPSLVYGTRSRGALSPQLAKSSI